MNDIIEILAAFVGAFLGSLAAHNIADLSVDLKERRKLKKVIEKTKFDEQYGSNVIMYIWKRQTKR